MEISFENILERDIDFLIIRRFSLADMDVIKLFTETKTWGRELPSISKDTIDAANKLFEDYYNSKKTEVITE